MVLNQTIIEYSPSDRVRAHIDVPQVRTCGQFGRQRPAERLSPTTSSDREHCACAACIALEHIPMASSFETAGFSASGPSPFLRPTAAAPAPASAAAPQPSIWNPATAALPTAAPAQAAPVGAPSAPAYYPQEAQFDSSWASPFPGVLAGGQATDAQSCVLIMCALVVFLQTRMRA